VSNTAAAIQYVGEHPGVCANCGQGFRGKRGQVACSRSCSRQAELGRVEDRFWAKVAKGDGCWLWTGQHNVKGYGAFKLNKQYFPAHRFAWTLINGPIAAGLEVAHTCDVRDCVRPDHLWLATHQENIADMVAKERRASTAGSLNPNYRHGRYVVP
jgi:hypothetical protein